MDIGSKDFSLCLDEWKTKVFTTGRRGELYRKEQPALSIERVVLFYYPFLPSSTVVSCRMRSVNPYCGAALTTAGMLFK
jgi:hypothetical protein